MQIASRVRTLPPFKIQSRAMVRNFNAQYLQGKTLDQIVAEAQGGYSPHARLHDHSLAADGQTINARAINCFGDPVQALIQGYPTNVATYYGLVAYPGGPAWLNIDNYIPGHETWVYIIADIDTDALQIGGESKEGGNISVWRDTSNNKQMFLDADADGATVKTGLEIYADIKVGRVGSGFVYKSPDGTVYRLIISNDGFVSVEPEAGGTAVSPVHSLGEYGDATTLKGHVKLEEGSNVTITRSDAHNSLIIASSGVGAEASLTRCLMLMGG